MKRESPDLPGPDELSGLPPRLRALDQELRCLSISERESFGPELKAELEQAWIERSAKPTRAGGRRGLLAAGLATLLLATLGVPPARAGLVRILVAVQDGATEVLSLPKRLATPEIRMEPSPAEAVSDAGVPDGSVSSDRPSEVGAGDASLRNPAFTVPVLADRGRTNRLIQSFYPRQLRREGVGGAARLLLWVDDRGRVLETRLSRSSGVGGLDRAALAAAPSLRFEPASRHGEETGSWVEFDVRFEPPLPDLSPSVAGLSAPSPAAPEVPDLDLEAEWRVEGRLPPPSRGRDARDLLRTAMDGERSSMAPGEVDELLSGEPPPGALPLRWREEAVDQLQAAIVRYPDNPAPFLALARIRRKQGLRSDARRLYERGLERAERAVDEVAPRVVADLHYERGLMIQEDWLPWSRLGKVPSVALETAACFRAPTPRSSHSYAPAEILIAWNYLCPGPFDRLMATRVEPLEPLKESSRQEMLRSYYGAVEAYPGHVEANVTILLDLADRGDWEGVLEGAHYFLSASAEHPYAHLLIGLALHRLGRSQDASVRFHQALALLPSAEAASLVNAAPLLDAGSLASTTLAAGAGSAGEAAVRRFWNRLDPLLTTAVNEREVEHLARGAYALLRFGSAETDAGTVWVRYGRPDRVRTFGEGTAVRTEFWDYGPGPDVSFRRSASARNLALTPEARAYLEELRQVFPHRYAPASSEILSLSSQRARFRSGDGEGTELEIHTQVPGALLSALADSLELGVFLLSAEGRRWTVERRRVPARLGPVHLRVPLDPEANRVVVELYEPRTGRAAALRSPVAVTDGGPEGRPTLSDLLLVEPSAPFQRSAVRRSASWVRPRSRPGTPERGEAGVLFEIYDLPEEAVQYFLSLRLEDLESGQEIPVPFKPVEGLEFRRVWERHRKRPGTVAEYATLDIRNVPPGAYLLRVEVEVPGQDLKLRSTRALDVGSPGSQTEAEAAGAGEGR